MEKFYSLKEVEAKLGVSYWRLNYAMDYFGVCKEIQKIGRNRVFSKSNLDELRQFFSLNKETESPFAKIKSQKKIEVE